MGSTSKGWACGRDTHYSLWDWAWLPRRPAHPFQAVGPLGTACNTNQWSIKGRTLGPGPSSFLEGNSQPHLAASLEPVRLWRTLRPQEGGGLSQSRMESTRGCRGRAWPCVNLWGHSNPGRQEAGRPTPEALGKGVQAAGKSPGPERRQRSHRGMGVGWV